jgi:choline dehydrogenase-like flavoprotein
MSAGPASGTPDVLIVGAGPSGATAAKWLVREGFSVVCLEQGDWLDYSTARAGHPDYEVTAGRDWNWDPNGRAGAGDYPVDDTDSDVSALMWNGVGGSAIMYSAHWARQLPSDFRVRSLDGVGDDWPFTYEDLIPHYVQTEKDFCISGLAGDPAYPAHEGPPMPPIPLNHIGRKGAKALNELGWHWWPGSNAIATRRYGNLNPCVQRASCLWGCPTRAKSTPDLTHWPEAMRMGAQLVTGARVRQLPVDRQGRITGAVYIDRNGDEQFQPAAVTILAANGVGTPRLLLLSADASHPDGLANSSGLVGRRLMMHPFGTVIGLFGEDLESWRGPWGQHLQSLQFYETDESRGFVRGAKWGLMPTGSPLSVMTSPLWGQDDVFGDEFHATLRARHGRSAMWGVIAEDLPEEHNRVTISGELVDPDGLPAPKIEYRISKNSRRIMEFNLARAAEAMDQMGSTKNIVTPNIRASGWHLLGTCKMGTDPSTSVVDEWGRAHDHPNLFVFDGSVFPTSSGVNPTATSVAVALRFTRRLIETRSSQAVAA